MIRLLQWFELLSLPAINPSVGAFVNSQWIRFRHAIWISSAALVVEPALMVLILGFGLGPFVSDIHGQKFIAYSLPGIASLTVMMVAYTEVGYGTFRRLNQDNYYYVILQAPFAPQDIALGEIFWAAIKASCAGLCLILLGWILGQVPSWQATLLPVLFFLSGLFFGGLGSVVATSAKSSHALALFQALILIPMALGGDTFFPLTDASNPWGMLGQVLPLTHVTQATRALVTGQVSASFFLNFSLLLLLTMVTLNISKEKFARRLIPS